MLHSKRFSGTFLSLALLMVGASSQAAVLESQITISRALQSPTLTIRYAGVRAATAELFVNGESLGTRGLSVSDTQGEINFTLNLAGMRQGDNDVEVRLFSVDGKLLGTQKSTVTADSNAPDLVFLTKPAPGATLRGPAQISLGLKKDMKDIYVSFFVDNEFKVMSNFPPFEFTWDTERESNGWHEVEAWVVDGGSSTFKTKKIRVYVNNPGGQTKRLTVPQIQKLTLPKPTLPTLGQPATPKMPSALPVEKLPVSQLPTWPSRFAPNAISAPITAPISAKPVPLAAAQVAGQQFLMPTGERVIMPKVPVTAKLPVTPGPAPKSMMLPRPVAMPKPLPAVKVPPVQIQPQFTPLITGFRLPVNTTLQVMYNNQLLTLDVPAQTLQGIPVAPFRHLIIKAGGTIEWMPKEQRVFAHAADKEIEIQIGDTTAQINKLPVTLEIAPSLLQGRTVVPLSFLRDALNLEIEYDPKTQHVLITTKK